MGAKEDLCSKVVALAAQILKSEGPDALTVRRIAHDSGASTQLIYTLFGGKFGLIDCLYRQGFQLMSKHMSTKHIEGNPKATLEAMILGYREFAAENPAYFTIMYTRPVPEYNPPEESKRESWKSFEILLKAVTDCQSLGLLPGDPSFVGRKIWSQVHGIVSLESIGHLWDHSGDTLMKDLVENLWR